MRWYYLFLGVIFVQLAVAADPVVPGSQGAVSIPLELAEDGEVTIALFNDQGQLVRPLAQVLPLPAGRYRYLWDGMDMWGKLLPVGSKLQAHIITNPGLRAFYEMSIDQHGGHTPWPSRVDVGAEQRIGGWLGDHSPPRGATIVNGRLFLSCGLAEHGSNIIACTLEGEKVWGTSLESWKGPAQLTDNGRDIICSYKNTIYRYDAEDLRKTTVTRIPGKDVGALAAHGDTILAALAEAKSKSSAFRTIPIAMNFAKSLPFIKSGKAPTDKHQSPRGRFMTLFNKAGHFDAGISYHVDGSEAYVLAVFTKPVEFGTMVLDQVPEGAAIKYLPADATSDPLLIRPDSASPGVLHKDWRDMGAVERYGRMVQITTQESFVRARALLISLSKVPASKRPKQLAIARLHQRRFTCISAQPKTVTFNADVEHQEEAIVAAGFISWEMKEKHPISIVKPSYVMVDYGQPQTFRGARFLNCPAAEIELQAWTGPEDVEPSLESELHWTTVGTLKSKKNKFVGMFSSMMFAHERYLDCQQNITARAVRLYMKTGRFKARHHYRRNPDEPYRSSCASFSLQAVMDQLDEDLPDPTQEVFVVSGSGKRTVISPSKIKNMQFAPDGQLYAVTDGRLCSAVLAEDRLVYSVLNKDVELPDALGMDVDAEHIAVGEASQGCIHLFHRDGRYIRRIGAGRRQIGKWNPNWIHKPNGVALDSAGHVWVAEEVFAPKRVARFTLDGVCDKQMFGPPMYGGGGYLDPDLKHFYYRGQEFALDWEAGTAELAALNDRLDDPDSPLLETNSFHWTDHGEVRYVEGRRYLISANSTGVVITLKADDNPRWRPAAVLAHAHGSPFLLDKECWNQHWLLQDLSNKSFIWCDLNDDGAYQVEEVQLVDEGQLDVRVPFRGGPVGQDLTLWGRVRLQPSSFTPGGAPIYRMADIQVLPDVQAPLYKVGVKVGMRAKPNLKGFPVLAPDGSRVREGQPYILKPDGSIVGGQPTIDDTGFHPPIVGSILQYPMGWSGVAETASPLGSVGIMHGNNGIWNVVALKYGLMVGKIFTGSEGSWGNLPDQRGIEVTGRQYRVETFHGDFIKAHDGRYYTVGGKGFQAISRIEGLDDYQIAQRTVTVDAQAHALNTAMRERLIRQPELSDRVRGKRLLEVPPLARRARSFQADGRLDDWGPVEKMQILGPKQKECYFDASFDEKGLYLAMTGWSFTENRGDNIPFKFASGFGLDFKYHLAGGRRLLCAPHEDGWVAVRYDYKDDSVAREQHVVFTSPVVETSVARVTSLPADQFQVAFQQSDVADPAQKAAHGDRRHWSAEIFISWTALGYTAVPDKMQADVGVLDAVPTGDDVGERFQWANAHTIEVSDVAVEAWIRPKEWGSFNFRKPR